MTKSTELFLSQAKSSISSSKGKLQIIFLAVGIIVIIVGLTLGNKFNVSGSKVEVLQTPGANADGNNSGNSKIIVDISGAVENPGVYHLLSTSRIEDALIASGGLSVNADRNWVDKNLNRAAKLIDGQKIYIPNEQSNVLSASNSDTKSNVAQLNSGTASETNGLTNINIASLSELDSLAGIGPVYAQKIVDQRPYSDINELVTKKVIPQTTFTKIKNVISVY